MAIKEITKGCEDDRQKIIGHFIALQKKQFGMYEWEHSVIFDVPGKQGNIVDSENKRAVFSIDEGKWTDKVGRSEDGTEDEMHRMLADYYWAGVIAAMGENDPNNTKEQAFLIARGCHLLRTKIVTLDYWEDTTNEQISKKALQVTGFNTAKLVEKEDIVRNGKCLPAFGYKKGKNGVVIELDPRKIKEDRLLPEKVLIKEMWRAALCDGGNRAKDNPGHEEKLGYVMGAMDNLGWRRVPNMSTETPLVRAELVKDGALFVPQLSIDRDELDRRLRVLTNLANQDPGYKQLVNKIKAQWFNFYYKNKDLPGGTKS